MAPACQTCGFSLKAGRPAAPRAPTSEHDKGHERDEQKRQCRTENDKTYVQVHYHYAMLFRIS